MLSNNNLKTLRKLRQKKYRQELGQFFIEGQRLVKSALESGVTVQLILLTDTFRDHPDHAHRLRQIEIQRIPVELVSEKTLSILTQTETPQGIVAVCALPITEETFTPVKTPWIYFDQLRNPGNMGTLLRSAAWFGIDQVACSSGCIDPYNDKVLRSAMGAHFNLHLHTGIELQEFPTGDFQFIAADQTAKSWSEADNKIRSPWVLILGNEAHGLSKEIMSRVDLRISIPKLGSGESLNVAMAGSILLYNLTAGS